MLLGHEMEENTRVCRREDNIEIDLNEIGVILTTIYLFWIGTTGESL